MTRWSHASKINAWAHHIAMDPWQCKRFRSLVFSWCFVQLREASVCI